MTNTRNLRPFMVTLSNGETFNVVAYGPGDAIASALELSTDRNVSVLSVISQHEW